MAEPKPPVVTKSHATWISDLRFTAAGKNHSHEVDGDGTAAPSPVETFLGALATCSGADVVDFLKKRRTLPTRLEINVVATRRGDYPRRVMKLELTFTIDGPAVEADQAERAIALSFERYCTVAGSLAGDIELTSVLLLNGERRAPVKQPMFSATFP